MNTETATRLELSYVDESGNSVMHGVSRCEIISPTIGQRHGSSVAHYRRLRLLAAAVSVALIVIVLIVTNANSESRDVGLGQFGSSRQQIATFIHRPLSPGAISFTSKQSSFDILHTPATINEGNQTSQKWVVCCHVYCKHPGTQASWKVSVSRCPHRFI